MIATAIGAIARTSARLPESIATDPTLLIRSRRFGNQSVTALESAKSSPRPGQPVRGSRTGRPVMALLDLLGRRWSLRVLWELREGHVLTFRELQARCGDVSSSVLNDRLRELREARIIATRPGRGYVLTRDGEELLGALLPLDAWAKRWARRAGTPDRTP
jgi:DNA-binding HxlR family transcriptional regulator